MQDRVQGHGQADAGAPTKTILIVDDDPALGEMLSIVLESEGLRAVVCQDGLRAVELASTLRPDLILLDVMLPGLDGVGVAREIRRGSNVPIIMLTAKSDTIDVVAGLEAGADDYVAKPFRTAELLARIRARFRIAAPYGVAYAAPGAGWGTAGDEAVVPGTDATDSGAAASADAAGSAGRIGSDGRSGTDGRPERIERGVIVIDRRAHTAVKRGRELALTPMEFELLAELASRAGEAIGRPDLLRRVWGYEDTGDTRLVNVHIQRLRAKVEDDPEHPAIVTTVRGIGYRFVTPQS
ncbi:response regulator transcription factor [Bifidobacterium samirii]|uniref:DNA-binding response regulator n=1 Tax=Bifidobacterium samirii TaxID=2306974 RepID=A0A430FTY1_9BIFI|nr:DNA-binding response regulator [Bifidobacterium samirii]